MAEKAEAISSRTYMNLWRVAAGTSYLPEREAWWAEEDESNRSVHRQEWLYLMGVLENLEDRYREGKMTPGQEAGYEELKGLLKESVPILERLGFTLPPIPLENT